MGRIGSYEVDEANLAGLVHKVGILSRRAVKLGCAPLTLSIGERLKQEEVKDSEGWRWIPMGSPLPAGARRTGQARIAVAVTLEGEAPKLAGWAFRAKLQHAEEGNILRTVPGSEPLPERFRVASPACDHCKINRRRIDTYALVSDAGEWRQVGSTCLADFLGHPDPHGLAASAELIAIADELCRASEWGDGGGRVAKAWNLEAYLAFVGAAIDRDGWISRRESDARAIESTAGTALRHLIGGDQVGKRETRLEPSETHEATAKAAIEWAQSVDTHGNDYLHNLSVVALQGIVDGRTLGFGASMLPAYQRAMGVQRERARAAAESRHFGTVGKREVFAVEVIDVVSHESDYGVTHIHRMRDEAGNRATWFSSGTKLDPGTYDIKATVKKHDAYQGIPQTVLTRCAVVAKKDEAVHA